MYSNNAITMPLLHFVLVGSDDVSKRQNVVSIHLYQLTGYILFTQREGWGGESGRVRDGGRGDVERGEGGRGDRGRGIKKEAGGKSY